MFKLKKNDEVIITSGKDRGKRGKIEKILPKINAVFLPGLNIYKRHLKKRDEKSEGGIIDLSRPIPMGNVALICKKCARSTRIGFRMSNDKKVRICKRCGEEI